KPGCDPGSRAKGAPVALGPRARPHQVRGLAGKRGCLFASAPGQARTSARSLQSGGIRVDDTLTRAPLPAALGALPAAPFSQTMEACVAVFTSSILLLVVLVTATVSGVFGM